MGVLVWLLLLAGVLIMAYFGLATYMAMVLRWEDQQTVGLGYYGRPLEGRREFKTALRRHARRLRPFIRWMNRTSKLDFSRASFRWQGVAGPRGSCSEDTFRRAAEYQPRPEDVFVVTQMKCGTTWMQHLVYQVLLRGKGNLVETGTALYAVCPWIEGRKSVPVEDAPLVGEERPARIIKTHLPAQLLPDAPGARYIYVARHPVSCFASCVDFVATNAGGMTPSMETFDAWFRSPELMWWGTWPDHVRGWWDRARGSDAVLFIFFEDMKADLAKVARRVADFLGVRPLDEGEMADVIHKCSFRYMQENQDAFEMHPPHVLQTNAELFVAGTADRHQAVPEATRAGIAAWCATSLEGSGFPLLERYPDVAGTSG